MGTEKPSVLLVEDTPDDVALTLRAFEKSNFSNEVIVTRDGQEALDYLFGKGPFAGRDTRTMPTLILLDLNMPRLGGIEVLKRIRAESSTKLIPVVILTSSREQRDIAASYENHCNSYIRKPVDYTEFQNTAKQLGLYWMVLNQHPPTLSV